MDDGNGRQERVSSSLGEAVLDILPCRAGFRSEPRYVISEDATLTTGVGAVTSLAGIVVFSESLLMASGAVSDNVCVWVAEEFMHWQF